MDTMPPPSKQPRVELSSSKIDDLADADLAAIFKHLPPYERLIVSEVCRRWRDLSRMVWLEIAHLDLSPIPGPNIGPIVKLCPNLRSVFAVRKTFGYQELACLARVNLSSVKLYGCRAIMPGVAGHRITDAFSTFFSEHLPNADWSELVLHDLHFKGFGGLDPDDRDRIDFPAASLPRSLKRLQLSGAYCAQSQLSEAGDDPDPDAAFLRGLESLQDLECLMLLQQPDPELEEFDLSSIDMSVKLLRLRNLRELCLGLTELWFDLEPQFTLLPEHLPHLEVLFLHDIPAITLDRFLKLIPKLTKLRILVITGGEGDVYMYASMKVPARKRFPGAEPLPLLHVFVGEPGSRIRFTEAPSDALEVHQINEPLAQFLEREHTKPIFEGVWIAQKIKEAAKLGFMMMWNDDDAVD